MLSRFELKLCFKKSFNQKQNNKHYMSVKMPKTHTTFIFVSSAKLVTNSQSFCQTLKFHHIFRQHIPNSTYDDMPSKEVKI